MFSLSLYTRDFSANSRKEARGVVGMGKVPQLFFFFCQTVPLNDCLPGPKQEWLLLSNEYSNNFIWPINGHISDKWIEKAVILISKGPAAGQRELTPGNFRRNTHKAG